jgi:3-hydroxyisobutyrate dehydrogenase-like beta-hydroxyacid dehydrogenase
MLRSSALYSDFRCNDSENKHRGLTMKTAKRIAFLGTGLMGKPMAGRLLQAGHQLIVWNRSRHKTRELQELGALVADTPAQAVHYQAQAVDMVITMLEDGHVTEQILYAILPTLDPHSIVIDMSSTQQAEAKYFYTTLEKRGIRFSDAPVSGGVLGAEAGNLTVMVGATPDTYQMIAPVLQVFGRVTHVGAPGSGQLAKLCNQLIVGGTLTLVAEALLLAQAGGADPHAVRQALRGGFAESRILEVHGQRMLDRDFIPGGQIKSQAKDMVNVLSAAQGASLHLPMAELINHAYQAILREYGNADQAAALLGLEKLNPQHRLGQGNDSLPD